MFLTSSVNEIEYFINNHDKGIIKYVTGMQIAFECHFGSIKYWGNVLSKTE